MLSSGRDSWEQGVWGGVQVRGVRTGQRQERLGTAEGQGEGAGTMPS